MLLSIEPGVFDWAYTHMCCRDKEILWVCEMCAVIFRSQRLKTPTWTKPDTYLVSIYEGEFLTRSTAIPYPPSIYLNISNVQRGLTLSYSEPLLLWYDHPNIAPKQYRESTNTRCTSREYHRWAITREYLSAIYEWNTLHAQLPCTDVRPPREFPIQHLTTPGCLLQTTTKQLSQRSPYDHMLSRWRGRIQITPIRYYHRI